MKNESGNNFKFKGIAAGVKQLVSDFLPLCPHQVISHQLISRESVSVTGFFFDKEEGISTDIQHQDILYIVHKGSAKITVQKKPLILGEGECIFVPSGYAHSIDAESALWLIQISAGDMPEKDTESRGSAMEKKDYIKNIEKAQIKVLSDLVGYHAGKVSSLTLIQRDIFTTTVMAMDKGTGVGPHICEGDAMVIALDGEGDVMIGDEHHTIKKGECIVMPADISHAVRGENHQFKMLLIVSKPEIN